MQPDQAFFFFLIVVAFPLYLVYLSFRTHRVHKSTTAQVDKSIVLAEVAVKLQEETLELQRRQLAVSEEILAVLRQRDSP